MPRILWVRENIINLDFNGRKTLLQNPLAERHMERPRKIEFYNALCTLNFEAVKSLLGNPPSIEKAGIAKDDPTPINVLISFLKARRGETLKDVSKRRARAYNLINLLLDA